MPSGPSQSSVRRDVSRKPILVIRVSRGPRLASHDSGATASHGVALWRPGSPVLTRPSFWSFLACPGIPVTTELEITCLHWAFAKLHHYLEGSQVIIVTDHESINGILNSSPGTVYSGRLDKVRMALMPYMDNIRVVYKPGAKMQNVDTLSRAPAPSSADEKGQRKGEEAVV
jgi:hypothetical protein